MLRATSVLIGCTIQAKDGKAGHVSDVLFDGVSWKVRWLVVATGSWSSARLVLIHPSSIDPADGCVDRLYVELTKEQIATSRSILQEPPVSRQMESDFGGGDKAGEFWDDQTLSVGAAGYRFMAAPPLAAADSADASGSSDHADDQDPNLRSAREVSGYHVRAVDGDIGHVLEFLIDDDAWSLRYLIIDTRNWLTGRHVMLAPLSVIEIDFWRRRLRVSVTREQVRNSPPAWEPEKNVFLE